MQKPSNIRKSVNNSRLIRKWWRRMLATPSKFTSRGILHLLFSRFFFVSSFSPSIVILSVIFLFFFYWIQYISSTQPIISIGIELQGVNFHVQCVSSIDRFCFNYFFCASFLLNDWRWLKRLIRLIHCQPS